MAPVNSRNTQALKDSMLDAYPGMTFYTFPDEAHMAGRSDHNWDDGNLLTEQTDSDSKQEVRAGDMMIGPRFTKAQAYAVVALLITVNKARVYYVIFDGFIWHSKRGFRKEVFTGANKHHDHIHCSPLASEDENTSPWIVIKQKEGNDVLEGKDLQNVIATKTRLENTVAMKDKTPIDWDVPNVPGNTENNLLVTTLKRIDVNAHIAASQPTTVQMSAEDRAAIVVAVTENILQTEGS